MSFYAQKICRVTYVCAWPITFKIFIKLLHFFYLFTYLPISGRDEREREKNRETIDLLFYSLWNVNWKELTNYGLLGKCGPLPVFVKKILLEHSHAHSFTHYPWLLWCHNAEFISFNRDCMAHNA